MASSVISRPLPGHQPVPFNLSEHPEGVRPRARLSREHYDMVRGVK